MIFRSWFRTSMTSVSACHDSNMKSRGDSASHEIWEERARRDLHISSTCYDLMELWALVMLHNTKTGAACNNSSADASHCRSTVIAAAAESCKALVAGGQADTNMSCIANGNIQDSCLLIWVWQYGNSHQTALPSSKGRVFGSFNCMSYS